MVRSGSGRARRARNIKPHRARRVQAGQLAPGSDQLNSVPRTVHTTVRICVRSARVMQVACAAQARTLTGPSVRRRPSTNSVARVRARSSRPGRLPDLPRLDNPALRLDACSPVGSISRVVPRWASRRPGRVDLSRGPPVGFASARSGRSLAWSPGGLRVGPVGSISRVVPRWASRRPGRVDLSRGPPVGFASARSGRSLAWSPGGLRVGPVGSISRVVPRWASRRPGRVDLSRGPPVGFASARSGQCPAWSPGGLAHVGSMLMARHNGPVGSARRAPFRLPSASAPRRLSLRLLPTD